MKKLLMLVVGMSFVFTIAADAFAKNPAPPPKPPALPKCKPNC